MQMTRLPDEVTRCLGTKCDKKKSCRRYVELYKGFDPSTHALMDVWKEITPRPNVCGFYIEEPNNLLTCDACGQHAETEDDGLFYSCHDGNGKIVISCLLCGGKVENGRELGLKGIDINKRAGIDE